MHSTRPPPRDAGQLIIAVFGNNAHLKNTIVNKILDRNCFTTQADDFCSVEENKSYKVITTPDFFDEELPTPDQLIHFMAKSYPGPNLFILAIDSENTTVDNVAKQITKLQRTFGEEVSAHLVVVLADRRSLSAFKQLKDCFEISLMAYENLPSGCKNWCSNIGLFICNYKNYSEELSTRMRASSKNTRCLSTFPTKGAGNEAIESIFNVVLLGLTGTGKSATGNTILAAGNQDQLSLCRFKSEPSSMPVTTQCDIRTAKLFGKSVRVVDTPDFLSDQLQNSQAQVEECKKYCQPGQCVVLLVMQLNRVTESENEIVEKLEEKLGWRIRESTVVLLTHGEDLKMSLQEFVNESPRLRRIVGMCGNRIHVFRNSSKNHKEEVTGLIEKVPQYERHFPLRNKNKMACCTS